MVRARLFNLFLLLLLAGGGYLLFQWQTRVFEKGNREKLLGGRLFSSLDSTDLEEIIFDNSKGFVKLRKEKRNNASEWMIVEPIKAPADPSVVLGVLTHLTRLRSEEEVGKKETTSEGVPIIIPPTEFSRFGLDKPRFKFTAKTLQGTSETILVGEENSFNGYLFVKMKDSPQVMTVSGDVEYQINKGLYQLREKKLLSFRREEVREIEVELGGKLQYIIECSDKIGDSWVQYPNRFRADKDRVEGLISALAHLEASEFLHETSSPELLKSYGLDDPTIRVTVHLASGAEFSLRYRRQMIEQRQREYAMREGNSPIARISSGGVYQRLALTVDMLRDSRVLRFDSDRVMRVRLGSEHGKVELSKTSGKEKDNEGSDWTMISPIQKNIKDAQVEGLLYILNKLEIGTALASVPEQGSKERLTKLGLDDNAPSIELLDAEGRVISLLRLGRVIKEQRIVKSGEQEQVFLVDASILNGIKWTFSQYDNSEIESR